MTVGSDQGHGMARKCTDQLLLTCKWTLLFPYILYFPYFFFPSHTNTSLFPTFVYSLKHALINSLWLQYILSPYCIPYPSAGSSLVFKVIQGSGPNDSLWRVSYMNNGAEALLGLSWECERQDAYSLEVVILIPCLELCQYSTLGSCR